MVGFFQILTAEVMPGMCLKLGEASSLIKTMTVELQGHNKKKNVCIWKEHRHYLCLQGTMRDARYSFMWALLWIHEPPEEDMFWHTQGEKWITSENELPNSMHGPIKLPTKAQGLTSFKSRKGEVENTSIQVGSNRSTKTVSGGRISWKATSSV